MWCERACAQTVLSAVLVWFVFPAHTLLDSSRFPEPPSGGVVSGRDQAEQTQGVVLQGGLLLCWGTLGGKGWQASWSRKALLEACERKLRGALSTQEAALVCTSGFCFRLGGGLSRTAVPLWARWVLPCRTQESPTGGQCTLCGIVHHTEPAKCSRPLTRGSYCSIPPLPRL